MALLLTSFLWGQSPCEKSITVAPDYATLKKQVDKKILAASNLVTIAGEADSVLAKLIGAQSPVLLNWLKKRNLMSASEEKIASQWRQYYLSHFILARYPSQNPKVNTSVESLFSEINQLAFSEAYKQRLKTLFTQVKKDAKKLVMSWPIKVQQKRQITHKIDTMKLYWFEQLKESRYQSKPLEFIRWGMAYDPPHNEINIGLETRKYSTDENLYAVMAHEMGHSFDPCRWSSFFNTPNPFTDLITCLRSAKSVAAQKRDDIEMQASVAKKLLTEEMAISLKRNPTCNRSFYPPEGIQKEQILEAFADWFSAEVFATSTHLGKNPRPDLCEESEVMAGSSYPAHKERLQKIYFSQPAISSRLKTTAVAQHCPLVELKKSN